MLKIKFYSLFIITIMIVSGIVPAALIQLNVIQNLTSQKEDEKNNQNKAPIINKLSDESDTIDSFDVNPKSGRWAVTDSASSDTIQDSNLVIANYENDTTDQSYFATRSLIKDDSKTDFRFKTEVDLTNTSEFFRDQLGEPMTFDTSGDTQSWIASGTSTVSQSNGMLVTVTTASSSGNVFEFPDFISKNVYTNISFDVYGSASTTLKVYTEYRTGVGAIHGRSYYSQSITTASTNYNLAFSSFTTDITNESVLFKQVYFIFTATGTYYLDNIEILGSYDYATSINGGLENTWDFEDGQEYFYNTKGNISNFEDGTTESWSASTISYWTGSIAIGTGSLTSGSPNLVSSAVSTDTGLYIYKSGTFSDSVDASATGGGGTITLELDVSLDGGSTYSSSIESHVFSCGGGSTNFSFSDSTARTTTTSSLYYRLHATFSSCTTLTVTTTTETQATYYGLIGSTGSTANSGSQYLNVTTSSDYAISIYRGSLSMSAAAYSYLLQEFEPIDGYIDKITILDDSYNVLYHYTSATYSPSVWKINELHLTTSWSGTETGLYISYHFNTSAYHSLLLNGIFLFDTSQGDVEGFSTGSSSGMYEYTDPLGYNYIRFNTAVITTDSWISKSSISVDTTIFKFLTIRIKSNSANYFIVATNGGLSVSNPHLSTANSFETFTLDLSADSDWTGTRTVIYIYFRDSSNAKVAIGDQWWIDYILLTADTSASTIEPFMLGLYDQDNSLAVVNVTQYYFDNSSGTYFQWRISLVDSNNDLIAYYYDTTNISWSDVYYRGTITYAIPKTSLSVEIKTDGGTRLFKISYPDDFTLVSTSMPAVFTIGKPPKLFFDAGHQDIFTKAVTRIDFINDKFKEMDWNQVTTPTDDDWLVDTPYSAYIQNYVSNQASKYRLAVNKLDSVSGNLHMNITDVANWGTTDASIATVTLRIYAVTAETGELNQLLGLYMYQSVSFGGSGGNYLQIYNATGHAQAEAISTDVSFNPLLEFSVTTRDDRSQIDVTANLHIDETDTNYTVARGFFSEDISNIVTNPSQEYVIEIEYTASITDSSKTLLELTNFAFARRDFLSDPIGTIIGIAVDFVQAFINFFVSIFMNFIFPLFMWIGTLILSVILGIVSGLEPFFNSIVSAVGAIAQEVANALSGFFSDLASAIGDIAGQVWQIILDGINDLIDAISAVISAVVDLFWQFIGLVWAGLGFIVQIFQDLFFAALDFLLDTFNLRGVFDTLVSIWTFIVNSFVTLWLLSVFMVVSFPFVYGLLSNYEDAPQNIVNAYNKTWNFDISFGLGQGIGFPKMPLIVMVTILSILFGGIYSISMINTIFGFL